MVAPASDGHRAISQGRERVRLGLMQSATRLAPNAMWDRMAPLVRALPERTLDPSDLLVPHFSLAQEGRLHVYWIPFERLNADARLVIVGLTPGIGQMEEAFTAARDALLRGMSTEAALDHIDRVASFAGAMRTNMVTMLDSIGLPDALGISSTRELFGSRDSLVHTTSALRYPVLRDGNNYSGTGPRVAASPLLRSYVTATLAAELEAVPRALVLPLGKAVEGCLRMLIDLGRLDETRCLFGFPHPSGGNGHRLRQFRENVAMLRREIQGWSVRVQS